MIKKIGKVLLIVSIALGVVPSIAIFVYYCKVRSHAQHLLPLLSESDIFRWSFWVWTIGSAYALKKGLRKTVEIDESKAKVVNIVIVIAAIIVPIILILTKLAIRDTYGATWKCPVPDSREFLGQIWHDFLCAWYSVVEWYIQLHMRIAGHCGVAEAIDNMMRLPAIISFIALVIVCKARAESAEIVFFIFPLIVMQFYITLSPVPRWTSEMVNGELIAAGLYYYADRST